MKAYSTREVAELLGISRAARPRAGARRRRHAAQRPRAAASASRSRTSCCCARPRAWRTRNVPPRRIVRALKALADRLPADRPLERRARADRRQPRDRARQQHDAGSRSRAKPCSIFRSRELGEKVAPLARETMQRALHAIETPTSCFRRRSIASRSAPARTPRRAYREVLERSPDHVAARINLGRLRHVARALDEAERLYREALELEPDHPTARFNLGVVLEDRGATARSDRGVSRSRAARSAGRRRALQLGAALSAGRQSASGACATSRASER